MAITVFVWLPRFGSVGHASMSGRGFYVSWWPDPNPTLRRTAGSPPDGYYFSGMPGIRLSIGEDKKEEGRIPDYASAPINDLNEAAIASWWRQMSGNRGARPVGKETLVKQNDATYAVFTNNCSAMVIRGLLVGGAAKNVWFNSVIAHTVVMAPRIVKDAAETLTENWVPVITNASTKANLLRDAYQTFLSP